jgi:hypothetical protein
MQKPAVVALLLALTTAGITPVRAGGGDVAAGVIGGLAAGTIIGAAVAGPRYYYPPPPMYVGPAHLLHTVIGRAESRYGMGTEACGLIPASEFASRISASD